MSTNKIGTFREWLRESDNTKEFFDIIKKNNIDDFNEIREKTQISIINIKDKKGVNLFEYAVKNNKMLIAEYLLKEEPQFKNTNDCLGWSIEKNKPKILEFLVKNKCDDKKSPIISSLVNKDDKSLDLLLKNKEIYGKYFYFNDIVFLLNYDINDLKTYAPYLIKVIKIFGWESNRYDVRNRYGDFEYNVPVCCTYKMEELIKNYKGKLTFEEIKKGYRGGFNVDTIETIVDLYGKSKAKDWNNETYFQDYVGNHGFHAGIGDDLEIFQYCVEELDARETISHLSSRKYCTHMNNSGTSKFDDKVLKLYYSEITEDSFKNIVPDKGQYMEFAKFCGNKTKKEISTQIITYIEYISNYLNKKGIKTSTNKNIINVDEDDYKNSLNLNNVLKPFKAIKLDFSSYYADVDNKHAVYYCNIIVDTSIYRDTEFSKYIIESKLNEKYSFRDFLRTGSI